MQEITPEIKTFLRDMHLHVDPHNGGVPLHSATARTSSYWQNFLYSVLERQENEAHKTTQVPPKTQEMTPKIQNFPKPPYQRRGLRCAGSKLFFFFFFFFFFLNKIPGQIYTIEDTPCHILHPSRWPRHTSVKIPTSEGS
jgi:hypothetical protein